MHKHAPRECKVLHEKIFQATCCVMKVCFGVDNRGADALALRLRKTAQSFQAKRSDEMTRPSQRRGGDTDEKK